MGSQFTGALFFRKNYKGYNERRLLKGIEMHNFIELIKANKKVIIRDAALVVTSVGCAYAAFTLTEVKDKTDDDIDEAINLANGVMEDDAEETQDN